MPDLEDVLSELYKFKENMQKCLKFIEKIEKLFTHIDIAQDLGATSISDLIDYINKRIIG